jgi:phage shock protein A
LGAAVTGAFGLLRLHYDIVKANALVRQTFTGIEEQVHSVDERALRLETELERLRSQLERLRSSPSTGEADISA